MAGPGFLPVQRLEIRCSVRAGSRCCRPRESRLWSATARGWLSVTTIRPSRPLCSSRASESPGNRPWVAIASIATRAGVAVGPRRVEQRAAGADHVVVDHDALAGDLRRHAGDLGRVVVAALVDERGGDVEVVGERLDPLRAAGVGAREHEVVAAEPARRRGHQRLAVDVDRPDPALEVVRDRGDVEIEQEHLGAAARHRDRRQQPRPGLGGHDLAEADRALHRRVAEERDHHAQPVRAAGDQAARQVVELERGARRRSCRRPARRRDRRDRSRSAGSARRRGTSCARRRRAPSRSARRSSRPR